MRLRRNAYPVTSVDAAFGLLRTLATSLAAVCLIDATAESFSHPASRIAICSTLVLLAAWWAVGPRQSAVTAWSEPAEWAALASLFLVLGYGYGPLAAYIGAALYRGFAGQRIPYPRLALSTATLVVPTLATDASRPPAQYVGLAVLGVALPLFAHLLYRSLKYYDRALTRERILRAGSDAVASATERREVHRIAVRVAYELSTIGGTDVDVTLSLLEGNTARVVSAAGAGEIALLNSVIDVSPMPPEQSAALLRGEPVLFAGDAGDQQDVIHLFVRRPGGVLILPLRAAQQAVGAISVSADPRVPEDIGASLATWATQIAGCLANLELHDELAQLAFHDSLTGLPNRAKFLPALDHALRDCPPDRWTAVLELDLNRFKPVNDTLGHHAGDLLLQRVAERIEACIGDKGLTARLGGDEFAALLPAVSGDHDAADVAERIIAALTTPFTVLDQPVTIGTSIGICIRPGGDTAITASEILIAADVAMYRAKASDDSDWANFDSPSMSPSRPRT